MKRKKAIKQIQEGKIQIENDLLPSTKEIKKFLKEAFPEDDYLEQNPKNTLIKNKYFFQHIKIKWFPCDFELNHLSNVKLSTITKRKKTKLSQLEKQFSDLAKDVSELRQTLANDVEVDVEEIEREIYTTGKKWFKDESYPNWLMCFDYENNKYYGIDIHSNWHCKEGDIRQPFSHEKEATPQEVQAALENEAKKRYVEGDYVNPNINGWANNIKLRGQETIQLSKAGELLYFGVCVFKDGIWAEIQQETIKEEIDWNIPQLVISDKGKIVATNGNNLGHSFEGIVVISDILLHPVNHFYSFWDKRRFKPFKGELTINPT